MPAGNCCTTWEIVTRQKSWAAPQQPLWQVHQITFPSQEVFSAPLCCHSREVCSFTCMVSWLGEMLTAHGGPICPEPTSSQSISWALWDCASVAEENRLFTFSEAHWSHQIYRINPQNKSMDETPKYSCLLLQKQVTAQFQRDCNSVHSWKEASKERPSYSPSLMDFI